MRFLFEAYKNIEPMIELFTPDELSPLKRHWRLFDKSLTLTEL